MSVSGFDPIMSMGMGGGMGSAYVSPYGGGMMGGSMSPYGGGMMGGTMSPYGSGSMMGGGMMGGGNGIDPTTGARVSYPQEQYFREDPTGEEAEDATPLFVREAA